MKYLLKMNFSNEKDFVWKLETTFNTISNKIYIQTVTNVSLKWLRPFFDSIRFSVKFFCNFIRILLESSSPPGGKIKMENYFLFKKKIIKKKTRNKVSSHASLKNVAPNKKTLLVCRLSAHYCKSKRETLGCLTGFCSTIQNRVSSTTGMSCFWEKKSINQCERERERERERENESRTKH